MFTVRILCNTCTCLVFKLISHLDFEGSKLSLVIAYPLLFRFSNFDLHTLSVIRQ